MLYGRTSHIYFPLLLDITLDTGLSRKLRTVRDIEMAGYADLTAEHARAAYLGGAGDTGLCGYNGIGTYHHIMCYLYKIVQLHTFLNKSRPHSGAVYYRVGAYLAIVLYRDYSGLRYLLVRAVLRGSEAETVGTDDSACMYDVPT